MKKDGKDQKSNEAHPVSRRTFAKGLTAAGLGAALGGVFPISAMAHDDGDDRCEWGEYGGRHGRWLREPERKIPLLKEVDVLVVGGGAAGAAAALTAARMGASTLVVEFFGCLGGNGSNGMVSNYCGITTTGPGSTAVQLVKGIGGDIINALAAMEPSALTTYKAPSFNPETLKRTLDQMAADAKLDILYYTQFTEPIMHRNRVLGAIVENKGGRQAILAKRVVDASGDGDVVARAGAPFTLGDGTGLLAADFQASDLVFQVADVTPGTNTGLIAQTVAATSDAELASYMITRKAVITMGIKVPGCYWFNWNNIALDGDKTDPTYLTNAAIVGRMSAAGLMRFLHDKIPGFENAKIIATAPKIGLRESRRVTGDYVFTKDDFLAARKFDDGIGANAWPLEIVTASGRTFQYLGGDNFYTIPYRSLLPKGVENVIMAGRFMSGSHDALASYRVMGPAMVMGHAAGVAAVLAANHDLSFRQLKASKVQNELLQQGAFLG
jgi:hypothetical protein